MLSEIKGITDRRLKYLIKMGIKDVYTLLTTIPRKYIDMNNLESLNSCKEGELSVIKVRICDEPNVRYIRKNMNITEMKVTDGIYQIDCYWFNQPYVAKKDLSKEYYLIGNVTVINGKRRFSSPTLEPVDSAYTGIVPIYSLPSGFRQKEFRTIIKNALEYARTNNVLTELCENDNLYSAIKNLHFPIDWSSHKNAIDRLKYDEAIYLACAFDLLTPDRKSLSVKDGIDYFSDFSLLLPFEMTSSQRKACDDILHDMKQERSMNRLLQGNVGCGKTIVAIYAIYVNYMNGFQTAFMAPTEVLAKQNYEAVKKYLPKGDVAFLSGSTTKSEKEKILAGLLDGRIKVVVGTHALIQENVSFKNLNLVISDEQHRFGVKQRAKISQNGCHTLIMSATPIPRTLALIAFKKLDISVINEMPKGREPVSTHIIIPDKRDNMYRFIAEQCEVGEQAYIVCPLINKSEAIEAKNANDIYLELSSGILKNCSIGLLHGRMKSEEKEKILGDFRNGKVNVLVSTTVVEVGVDVPNATIMVIENSDRFGLATLHQLRGRVGRGQKKSYCFAVVYNSSSCERLQAFKQTTDGYEIALLDLSMRGVGELTGLNQHGGNVLKFLDLSKDKDILNKADDYIKTVKNTEIFSLIKKNTLRMYENLLDGIILN